MVLSAVIEALKGQELCRSCWWLAGRIRRSGTLDAAVSHGWILQAWQSRPIPDDNRKTFLFRYTHSHMFGPLRAAAVRAARPTRSFTPALRSFATTPRIRSDHHDHAPVITVGPGAKAGEVATDENQSTGLERYQVMGHHKGVDVFDMQGILMTRQGTLKDPILVPSFVSVTVWKSFLVSNCSIFCAVRNSPNWLHWLPR